MESLNTCYVYELCVTPIRIIRDSQKLIIKPFIITHNISRLILNSKLSSPNNTSF